MATIKFDNNNIDKDEGKGSNNNKKIMIANEEKKDGDAKIHRRGDSEPSPPKPKAEIKIVHRKGRATFY